MIRCFEFYTLDGGSVVIKDIKLTGERIVSIPLFSNMSADEAETLLQITDIAIYKENELIFKEGTPGTTLFVILEGTVDIIKQAEEGSFKTLARFQPYTAFGEIAILFDGDALRTASAIARERTRLLTLHKEDYAKLLDFGSILAYKIAFSISRILAARLSRVDQDLVRLMSMADESTKLVLDEIQQKKIQAIAVEGRKLGFPRRKED